jgi:hypothetical protein
MDSAFLLLTEEIGEAIVKKYPYIETILLVFKRVGELSPRYVRQDL